MAVRKSVIAVILSILCVFCFMPGIPQQAQAKSVKPGKVSHIKVKSKNGVTTIKWMKGRRAKKYKVMYQTGKGQNKTTHFRTTKNRYYTVKSAKKVGYVAIKSVNGKKKSAYKKWGKEDKTPEPVEDIWGNDTNLGFVEWADTALEVSWDKMRYAKKYKVTLQRGYFSNNKMTYTKVTRHRKLTFPSNSCQSNYVKLTLEGINKTNVSKPLEAVGYLGNGTEDSMSFGSETADSKKYGLAANRIYEVTSGNVDYRAAYRYVSNDKRIPKIIVWDATRESYNGQLSSDVGKWSICPMISDWCYKIIQEDLDAPDTVTSDWCYKAAKEWTYLQDTCGYDADDIDYAFSKFIYTDMGVKGIYHRNYKGEMKYYKGEHSIYYHVPAGYNGPAPWGDRNFVWFS